MELCDKDILEYISSDGKLIPSRCVKSVLERHGFYTYVVNRYSNNTLNPNDKEYLRECLYRILNGIDVPPVCKVCGKTITFSHNAYSTYCSRKCSNNDQDVLDKISNSCSKSLKEAYEKNGDEIMEKRKKTLSSNYGVDVSSASPFAVKEVQENAKKKVEELYGVDNVFKTEFVKEKRKKVQRLNSIKMQIDRGIDIEYLDNGNYLVKNCCPIHGDVEFSSGDFHNRFRLDRYHLSNPCWKCNPFEKHVSGMEISLGNYIKSIYSGTIIENDKKTLGGLEIDIYLPELKIGFEFNGDYWHMNPLKNKINDYNQSTKKYACDCWELDRHKIIAADDVGVKLYHVWEYYYTNYNNLQLDFIKNIISGNLIYEHPLVKLKKELSKIDDSFNLLNDMIFEYDNLRVIYIDGFYFNKNSITNSYLDTLISNEKRTIFVYDYEISNERKFDVILSDVRYALGKIENRVYARNCKLMEISNKDAREFLTENSLFGYRPASKTLALYHNNEIVMVYSFGNNYYGRKKYTEIIRVCTKKNTNVVGGSSKCLKYYVDNYAKDNETLIFYVDAIHHDGKSMNNGGFKYLRHEYGYMNYYVSFDKLGIAFNRTPSKNDEIKNEISKGNIVEVPTYGVYVYSKTMGKN